MQIAMFFFKNKHTLPPPPQTQNSYFRICVGQPIFLTPLIGIAQNHSCGVAQNLSFAKAE